MTAALNDFYGDTQRVHLSDWLDVDQSMIDRFADLTMDHNFIHVDLERAAASPLGGTIAHGFLTLSLLTPLRERIAALHFTGLKMTINAGFDRVRFVHPVRPGNRIRARWKPVSLEEKSPGSFQGADDVTVEIEGETKPAMTAIWLVRYIV